MNIKSLNLYCERLSPAFWAEPVNALTNILIFLGGVLGLRLINQQPKSSMKTHARVAASFAIITSIGSFLFHTFADTLTVWLDIAPISFFEITVINFYLLFIFHWAKKIRIPFLIGFVTLSIGLDLSPATQFLNRSLTYFPSLILLGIFSFFLYRKNMHDVAKWTFIGLVSFCLSLTARTLDMTLCDIWPLGTHFLWHSINGMVIFSLLYAMVLFMRRQAQT